MTTKSNYHVFINVEYLSLNCALKNVNAQNHTRQLQTK